MSYRILVTGTRNELTGTMQHAVRLALTDVMPGAHFTLVHGACPTGVDAFVDELWSDFPEAVTIERHPADWYVHDENCYHAPRPGGKCPAAGPRRNKLMVDLGADVCLAFPMGKSAGTRGCVKLAEAAGIPTVVTEL